MIKITLLLIGIFFQLSLFAQYSVKVGNENSGATNFEPCNNQYDYGWSATVYKQSDIKSHGQITDIFYKSSLTGAFGPGANTYMMNQRIFMKLVTNNAMTSNNFPDTNQMTLVYAGTVEFLNYQLAQIHLDTPFDLDENHNLMILYINKYSFAQTNNNYFLMYPSEHNQTPNNTVYNNGNGSFPSGAGTYTSNMPVVYLRYAPGLDAGISSINQNNTFILPQQTDLTCKLRNYMADTITSADIEWALNGTPQTTVNWTGNSYCGQETSPVVLQNNFAFAPGQYTVKANTTNPNSGSDELHTNDTLSININVSDNKIQAYQNYSNNIIPFRSNYSYGWSVSIYNKDSINFSGQIHSIAYFVNSTNGIIEPNQKIYMRTTPYPTNQSIDYPDTNLFTKVFEGEIDYSSPGWHIIKLDTVFDYNNAENLMVLYENYGGIPTSVAIDFKVGWQNTNAIYNVGSTGFPTNAGSVAASNRIPALRIYFSIPKDAGVTNLANSGVPVFTGNNDLIVDFKNYGLDTLQDVDIKYQVDNGTTNSYHWNGTTSPQNEITNLNVGTENLTYGTHDIKIWTENPDYLPDYANRNDTLKISLRACSPMSGIYTIGTAPSDFLTVKDAVDSLNNCGINGAVTFNIKPGTYNAQYILNKVWGTSPANTITFQSATGDSTDVILTTDSTDFIFKLDATEYTVFNHLTFTSDSALYFVEMDSTTSHISFTNNIFTSDTNIATFIYTPQAHTQSNISIDNNLFNNGNNGIDLNQDNLIENSYLSITNNSFINQDEKAIRLYQINNGEISGNNFTVNKIGIHLNSSDNIVVRTNKLALNSSHQGIYIDKCLKTFVNNNFIFGNSNGGFGEGGIVAYGYWSVINNYNIAYNTINLQSGIASFFNNADTVKLFNNIFISTDNQAISVFSIDNLESDYNCFFTENTIFGSYNAADNVTDFADWISQTQNDSNSVNIFPYFTSNTDLHTSCYLLDNKGIPVAGITIDIDGELRDTLTPDIGADEYTSYCSGPLAGNYTIGTTGDFTDFNDAVAALSECGVADTVVFEIEAGTYNEQTTINGHLINYINGIKPISFISQTQNPNDVVLQYDADDTNNFIIKIKNAKYISVNGITIQALDTLYSRVVLLESITDSIYILNNHIIGTTINNTAGMDISPCIYIDPLHETETMNFFISRNIIENGIYGIANNSYPGPDEPNLFIDSNQFINQLQRAVYVFPKTMFFTNNYVSAYSSGILAQIIDSVVIKNNIIITENNGKGIELYYGNNLIANNFIRIRNNNFNYNYGIDFNCGGKILNNTLLTSCNSIRLSVNSSNSAEILNNCIISASELIHNSSTNYSNLTIDYNNLFSSSSNFDLNSLVNTIGSTHFISFVPNFVSDTDLHTNSVLLYQAGTPLAEVTDDIDGDTRNNPPCIGADEFTNPIFDLKDTALCYFDQYFDETSFVYDIGYGYDSYQWSNGSDSSSIIIDTLNAVAGNNTYTVTVTVGANTYTDTINILYDLPDAITQTDYCYWNTPVTVTANPGFVSYEWSNGDTTQSIIYNSAGYPHITVTDNHGCQSRENIHIINAGDYYPYNTYPADFNISDTTICKNQSLLLTANQYTDSDVYNYFTFQWNTGDTTQSIIIDNNSFPIGINQISTKIYLISDTLCFSVDTVNVTINDCIGIETLKDLGINIFPNPANNFLNISNVNNAISKLEIIDLTGKIILYKEISQTNIKLNIRNLPSGTYFIRLKTINNKHLNYKFIKN